MKSWIFVFAIVFLASADDQIPDGLKHISSESSDSSVEELLKEKCEKNGNDSFGKLLRAKDDLKFCLYNLFNNEQMYQEIGRKGANQGDILDTVRLFCRMLPQLRNCKSNYVSAIEACLDEEEKKTIREIDNIHEAFMSFICFNDAEWVALFIAKGGPECLNDRENAIRNCMDSLFSKYLPKYRQNFQLIFKLEENECRDIDVFQKCIVAKSERCEEPTPASIIDSLFNFVRKVTPCTKYLTEQKG